MNIAEAMAKGIKPLVHNYFGSSFFYPRKFIFNTQDECVAIAERDYNPAFCRAFVADRFSLQEQLAHVDAVLDSLV
ncbi:hypothetical protein LJC23_01055 [Desulfovibrio sp. OttesenSCG-928-I05]|nr:hypothetical protein [Desulfovibrio sp. OttesenSCG-928-I05]